MLEGPTMPMPPQRSRPLSDPSQNRHSVLSPLPEAREERFVISGRNSPVMSRKGSQASLKSARSTTPRDTLDRSDSERSTSSRPSLRRLGSATKLFFGGSYRSQPDEDDARSEESFACIDARAIERAARQQMSPVVTSPRDKALPPLPDDVEALGRTFDDAASIARGKAQDLILRHLDLDRSGPLPPGFETPRELMTLAISEDQLELFARYFEFDESPSPLARAKYRLAAAWAQQTVSVSPDVIVLRRRMLQSLSDFYKSLQQASDGDSKLMRVFLYTVAQSFELPPALAEDAAMNDEDLERMARLGVMRPASREDIRSLIMHASS